jgi:hypothetical protein
MGRMPDADLVARIAATTGLRPTEAARVIDDVVSYYAEPTEEYVRRRHDELQTYGLRNAAIFEQISTELEGRVVAAPELSLRQLRRIVYG